MKTLFKNTFRQIWRTKGRFLSIMAIIALGSGFFAGIKVTTYNMKDTADKYYNEQELMDFRFKSEFGFAQEDIDRLSGLAGVTQISAGYSADVYMDVEDLASEIVKVYSFDFDNFNSSFNRPVLLEGRLPQSPDECLIEANTPYSIGDRINLSLDTASEDISDYLNVTEYTAVGRVMWPMYVDYERGYTNMGSGVINSYMIVPENSFAYEVYTDVYVRIAELDGVYAFSDKFAEITKEREAYFKSKCSDFAILQGQRLSDENSGAVEDARNEYENAKEEYDSQKAETDKKLSEAWQIISDVHSELEQNKDDLKAAKDAYDESLAQYEASIQAAEDEKLKLTQKKPNLEASQKELKRKLELLDELSAAVEGYQRAKVEQPYKGSLAELYQSLSILDTIDYSVTESFKEYLAAAPGRTKNTYKFSLLGYILEVSPDYESNLSGVESELEELSSALTENSRTLNILNDNKTQLDNTLAEIEQTEEIILQSEEVIAEQEKEYNIAKAEADEKFAEAELKLNDARKELEQAEADLLSFVSGMEWYVFTRDDNIGYSNYEDDANRVNSVAKIFPIFFILVAALVCFTTMTRMVEEQRTEIGTIKAMGYSRGSIMLQYLIYSSIASLVGVTIGLLICMKVFPIAIFNAYKLMYNYPDIMTPYRIEYVAGSLVVALLCTTLSSLGACYKALASVPARLMRPRPLRDGKRVWLEKVTFVWNRMSFLQKVAARNVFRFKNRVFMTVLGIGGCTALLLAGFTLMNSISGIIPLQYGEIFKYDFMAIYDNDADTAKKDALHSFISESSLISGSINAYQNTASVSSEKRSIDAYIFAPETTAKLSDFITLRERKSGNPLSLRDEGVVINEKLAKLLDLQKGDFIDIGASYSLEITGITENYAYNYVYMTSKTYNDLFGSYVPNVVIGNMTDNHDEDSLSEMLLEHDPVQIISYISVAGKHFRDLIEKLIYIVYLIVLSSAALAFVVLYNLSSISITERSRELATIKVLGFFDPEVSAYVYRENIVSAFLGTLSGLIGGIFLTRFVIQTAEVDMVMFVPEIPWYCFVLSGLLTLVFVFIVNVIMFFKIRKIDMASSMKDIE